MNLTMGRVHAGKHWLGESRGDSGDGRINSVVDPGFPQAILELLATPPRYGNKAWQRLQDRTQQRTPVGRGEALST